MATRAIIPPPRTPSPKIRIYRSQSFDSPSSRISVTPIDDSPYSKSEHSIVAKPLPQIDTLKAAEHGLVRQNRVLLLQKRMSGDSMLSDASSASSSIESSPISPSPSPSSSSQGSEYGLFSSGSPSLPSVASPLPSPSPTTSNSPSSPLQAPPEILDSNLDMEIYQDPSTPMYDPWLVRVVLDMYDVRGFDWMMIAEPIFRVWGFRTTSAEVLGILCGNGRVGRVWWD